ncbi:MAG TPA: metallophosphoesterase, partial [Acidimicrobiia bacterium]|nr:metallophosphoesterase [Acidimicrobiia bacterium]
FAFGDARFFGSMGGVKLNAPVRGMLVQPGAPDLILGPADDAPPGTPAPPAPPGTPAPPSQPDNRVATLVGAGDIASCGSNPATSKAEATAQLLEAIPSDPSTVVFTAGDNAYSSGSASEYKNCYDATWGSQKYRTRPSPGNHEYNTTGAAGYFGYFGAVAGQPGQGWYSYDLGAWHVVVLNSNCSSVGGCQAGSAQEKWLRADLAASPAACTVAIWHHPRFNSGKVHGNDTAVGPLWDDLYANGADLVLSGHEHVYERFAPQTPSGVADPAHGIRQFTVGTGGGGAYTFGTIQPNSEKRAAPNGVLQLTLRATGYDWNFIPVAGQTFTDSGTGACHGKP